MKRRKKVKLSSVFLHLFWIGIAVICIYPILLIVFNAISSESYITKFGYVAIPKEITLNAFQYLFRAPGDLLRAIFVTCVQAIGGGLFAVVIQAMLGYTLTRPDFALRKLFNGMLIVTMFFTAGLIPTYMVYTTMYHFENNWLVYLLDGCISAYNVFLFRTFFSQIPPSLVESAEIDGASHVQVFTKIILPMSMPIMGTQFFLTLTSRWTNYTTSLYYMSEENMYNLEHYIQQVLKNAEMIRQNLLALGVSADGIPLETMRFAIVVIAMLPLFVVFPFLQKYFTKGATVGAVKG